MIILSDLVAVLPVEQEVHIKEYQGRVDGIPEKYKCLPVGTLAAKDSFLVIETADVDKLSMSEMCALIFKDKGHETDAITRRFSDD